MHVDSSEKSQGYQAIVSWAVRLVSPLADSACSRSRPSAQLQQGRTMLPASTVVRSFPTCGLTTRWDWTGLDGCCASVTLPAAPLPASARGLSLVSCLQRSTRGSSVSVHSPSSICYSGRYIVTNLHRPRTPHAGLHIPVYAPTSPYSRPHEPTHSLASFIKLHFQTDKLHFTASPPASICEDPRF